VTLGQAQKALALFYGMLAAVAGFFCLRMKWTGGTDFDVTGFLWLLGNLGRLTVLVLFIVCLGTAISYWVRSWRY
jgi:hypothetical protein